MRGLDTNVLVRYLTQDDPRQARRANVLMAELATRRESCFLSDVVLCELVWVLRGAYGHDRGEISTTIEKVLDTTHFAFEDRDLVRKALEDFRTGPGDFADYLTGWRSRHEGCEKTSTFDRSLRRNDLFEVV